MPAYFIMPAYFNKIILYLEQFSVPCYSCIFSTKAQTIYNNYKLSRDIIFSFKTITLVITSSHGWLISSDATLTLAVLYPHRYMLPKQILEDYISPRENFETLRVT